MERSSVIINFPLFSVQMCVEIRKSITFAQVNVHKTRKPWEICAYINKPVTIVHQKKKNKFLFRLSQYSNLWHTGRKLHSSRDPES